MSTQSPIRVFIGSSPKNLIEERVFCHSLLKHASQPVEFYAIDGFTGSAKNLMTGEVKSLPPGIRNRMKGATAFSLGRWAIPEWCNYEGKAIYCDSDQILLSDITQLWNSDLAEATLAAVPVKQAKCYKHYIIDSMGAFLKTEETFYLASVMLIDCEKVKWSIRELLEKLDQNVFSLANLMYMGEQFRRHYQLSVAALPCEWNHLDYVDAESKLVHFTDLTSQPWQFHHNPVSDLWEQAFLEALDQGAVTQADIDTSYANGWLSGRVKALAQMPKSIRRPVNWIWRNSNATIFKLHASWHHQIERVKFVLSRLTTASSIRA
ncbi:MAG: hypothetical protein MUC48_07165 [Leptolyngbya sp. Prado105]|jgi:hypothetical protein|nr:hypothetical protein [Leptolyngbya sp. Prado105]